MPYKDLLVHVPIEDGCINWDAIDEHYYDYMLVVDDMAVLWLTPYVVGDLSSDEFDEFLDWITLKKKDKEASEAVLHHYQEYQTRVAFGLASKCVRYDVYRDAMWEAIKHRAMVGAAEGRITNEDLNKILKLSSDMFDKLKNSENLSIEEQYELADKLAFSLIYPVKPFQFIGVYHWDGDLAFARKDYVPGQSLSKYRIPKSAAKLSSDILSSLDYVEEKEEEDED